MLVAFLFLARSPTIRAQETPTPEQEKELAVKLTTLLENDPFNEKAKEAREWLTVWAIRVPDITVKACGAFLGSYFDKNKKYSSELLSQMVYGQAAFLITNPSAKDDEFAVYRAGLISSLRAYASIVKAKPKARDEYMDGLLAKLADGSIDEHVRSKIPECK